MNALSRLPWLPLSAVLSLLILLGTLLLGWDRSFWFDEVYTLGAAAIGRPLDWALLKTDVHPPLFNLSVRQFGALFPGDSPGLRAINLVGLAAALAALVLSIRPLGQARVLLLLCVLLTSGYALQLSLDLRAYALLLGFTALLHAFFLREVLLDRPQTLPLVVLTAVLAGLHFFGAAVGLAMLGVSALRFWKRGQKARFGALTLAIVAITAGVLIWAIALTNAGGKFTTGGNWIDLGITAFVDFAAEQLPLAILGLLLLVYRHAPKPEGQMQQAALLMLAVPAIVVLVTGALSVVAPLISTRNLTVCVPGLAFAAVLVTPDKLLGQLRQTPIMAVIVLLSGLRYGDTGISNFQMIEWAIETATPPACDGAALYTLDPGNVSRFSQEVFLGEVKRPMIDMRELSAAPSALPDGCDVIAVGWHQTGQVNEVVGFFTALGLNTEAILPPDPALAAKGLMTSGYVIRQN